ncbi:MAG: ATP-binding protein, partial [Campylobacterota bacterium]
MMQKLRDLNLTPFVVIVLFIALLIPTIISSYTLIQNEKQKQVEEIERFQNGVSRLLASSLAIPLWEFRKDSAMKAISPILDDKRLVFVEVKDTQTGQLFVYIKKDNKKGNTLTTKESIYNEDKKIGELKIGISDFAMKDKLKETISGYVILFIFQLFVSIMVLVFALYTKIISPIQRLTTQAKKLSKNELEESFKWSMDDEIGKLGKSFEYARQSLLENIEKIQVQKQRLFDILEGTHVGTWEWNIQTGETIFNERWAQIVGYTLDEISPTSINTWMDFAHPEDLEQSNELIMSHIEGKSDYYECESRMQHKNGSWVWVLDRGKVSKWDKDGKPLIMSGTHQDITKIKEAQNILQEAKVKAQEANKAKSEFLANMSHEIRTPMNAVIGLSEMLYDMQLNQNQKDIVSKINNSSKILLGIINDILDYSKIEAGRLELEYKEFEIDSLVTSLETLFKNRAKQMQIELKIDKDSNLPNLIVADELRLTQVLTNLVSNAIKFTNKGEVQISISLKDKVDKSTALIHFCVEDNGIGISSKQLQKLFTPFTQADTSTTRKYGGTGLGLVITKNIIKAFGSDIEVQSKEDIGTKIEFDIKLQVATWEKSQQKKSLEANSSNSDFLEGIKVLLVEDNEINQEVATMMLEKIGIEVDIASNGQEGVDKFLENKDKYQVILMDLQMPIMSGYEATKQIRVYDKKIPIIALTAAAMIEDKQKAQNAGMNEHLSKPIDTSQLYLVLSQYCKDFTYEDKKDRQQNSMILDEEFLDE